MSVTVASPRAAADVAATVSTLVPLVGFGLKVPVTPPGSPLKLKVTLPLKVPSGVTVTEPVAVPPRLTVGESADSEKSLSGGCTVRLIVVECVRPPLVPVIETADDIREAVLLAVNVSTVDVPVVEDGLNDAVTPLGRLLALNDTAPAN